MPAVEPVGGQRQLPGIPTRPGSKSRLLKNFANGLPETTPFRGACDGVKRVIHEGTRRTTKTHQARSRGGPEPFRAPDRPSGFPVFLSNDPPRRGGRGRDLPETTRFRAACDAVKRVIHEGARRTRKTHEARRRGEPEPFRAPDTPSGALFLSRMIRPSSGRGQNLPETTEKRVIHEDTRRTTKGH